MSDLKGVLGEAVEAAFAAVGAPAELGRVTPSDRPDLADFQPFFAQVSKLKLTLEGVDFWMVDGTGFKFQPYREQVLTKIAQEFHDIPHWLPLLGNPFCERYGFEACSPQGR